MYRKVSVSLIGWLYVSRDISIQIYIYIYSTTKSHNKQATKIHKHLFPSTLIPTFTMLLFFILFLGNVSLFTLYFFNKMFACLVYSQSTRDLPMLWISTNHNPYQDPPDNLILFNTCHYFQFFNQHLCFFRNASHVQHFDY